MEGLEKSSPKPVKTRQLKKRASLACTSCRCRKVRCDAQIRGLPCTNCRIDEEQCHMRISRRRRKKLTYIAQESRDFFNDLQPCGLAAKGHATTIQARNLVNISGDPKDRAYDSAINGSHPYLGERQYDPREHSIKQSRSSYSDYFACLPHQTGFSCRTQRIGSLVGQPFFGNCMQKVPEVTGGAEEAFISTWDAFKTPSLQLQRELLRKYVQFVHPFSPVVDLHAFLDAKESDLGAGHTISLLLYQSVMFAASSYADICILQADGYSTRQIARRALFNRARLLYEYGIEKDHVSILQSLILLTHWYDTVDTTKNTWHWVDLSVSLALKLGIHRDATVIGLNRQGLCRRLWWTCFVRQQVVGVEMQRCSKIRLDEVQVPLLSISDFDLEYPSSSNSESLDDTSSVYHTDSMIQLAQLFISKVKLCVYFNRIISTHYTNTGRLTPGIQSSPIIRLVAIQSTPEIVQESEKMLDNWLLYEAEVLNHRSDGSGVQAVVVHKKALSLFYFLTVSVLQRVNLTPTNHQISRVSEKYEMALSKLRLAAKRVASAAWDLHLEGLSVYLPGFAATTLLASALRNVTDINCEDISVSDAACSSLFKCTQVLQELRKILPQADVASLLIEAALQKTSRSKASNYTSDFTCHQDAAGELEPLLSFGNRHSVQSSSMDAREGDCKASSTKTTSQDSNTTSPLFSESESHICSPFSQDGFQTWQEEYRQETPLLILDEEGEFGDLIEYPHSEQEVL